MAFIYMAGGAVLEVPVARDAVVADIQQARTGLLEYDIQFRSGSAPRPGRVTLTAAQIAVVTDAPLAT
jgi:hypothetical protein